MTDRDDRRAQCIEAMAKAHYEAKRHINVRYPLVTWGELGPISKSYKLKLMTAAFDALDGIAFVDPIEATYEMLVDGDMCQTLQGKWRAMAAAGDLTNPPEEKP